MTDNEKRAHDIAIALLPILTSIGTSRLRSKVLIPNENFSFELQATPNSLEFFSYLNKLPQYFFENFQDYVFLLSVESWLLVTMHLLYVTLSLLSMHFCDDVTFLIDFFLLYIYNRIRREVME